MKASDIKIGQDYAYRRYAWSEGLSRCRIVEKGKKSLYSSRNNSVEIMYLTDDGNDRYRDTILTRHIIRPWHEEEARRLKEAERQVEASKVQRRKEALQEAQLERVKRVLSEAGVTTPAGLISMETTRIVFKTEDGRKQPPRNVDFVKLPRKAFEQAFGVTLKPVSKEPIECPECNTIREPHEFELGDYICRECRS